MGFSQLDPYTIVFMFLLLYIHSTNISEHLCATTLCWMSSWALGTVSSSTTRFMHVVFSMVWDPSLRQILNWGATVSKQLWKMNGSFSLMKFIGIH